MAYPSIHYGNFGDEKVTSTSKINSFPLGIKMVFPDGREYVHAKIGGTAAVAGRLYGAATGAYVVADTLYYKLVPTSTIAVNATTVIVTAGGTAAAVTKDQFADGYLVTSSSAGGGAVGYNYKVKANNSAAAGATCTITLYETDPVLVAMPAGTVTLTLTENRYAACEQTPAATIGVPINGVACNSAAASAYVWLQTKGVAAVYAGTALLERSPVVCSTVTAGAVTKIAVAATSALLATKQSFDVVGIGIAPSTDILGYNQVDLTLT